MLLLIHLPNGSLRSCGPCLPKYGQMEMQSSSSAPFLQLVCSSTLFQSHTALDPMHWFDRATLVAVNPLPGFRAPIAQRK